MATGQLTMCWMRSQPCRKKNIREPTLGIASNTVKLRVKIDRIASEKLGITPSFFVGHVFYWGDRHRDIFLEQRTSRISPLASALRRDIRFTIHNDTPVTPVDPLLLVWCSVNHRTKDGQTLGDEQRISTLRRHPLP